MRPFTIYHGDDSQNPKNFNYPHTAHITDTKSLYHVVKNYDILAARCEDYSRGKDKRYLSCNVAFMDVDNEDYINTGIEYAPEDIADIFTGVEFVTTPSRNHLREKKSGSKTLPPVNRFHVWFSLSEPITDAEEMRRLKENIIKYAAMKRHHGVFDEGVKDAKRFTYSTPQLRIDDIITFEGSQCIDEFISEHIDELYPVMSLTDTQAQTIPSKTHQTTETTPASSTASGFVPYDEYMNNKDGYHRFDGVDVIPHGRRNTFLTSSASYWLYVWGDNKQAKEGYKKDLLRCEDSEDITEEARQIWRRQKEDYLKNVVTRPNYTPPEEYHTEGKGKQAQNHTQPQTQPLKPLTYRDDDEAKAFVSNDGLCRYCERLNTWFVYTGKRWEESNELAKKRAKIFVNKQMAEVEAEYKRIYEAERAARQDEANGVNIKAITQQLEDDRKANDEYKKFVFKYKQDYAVKNLLSSAHTDVLTKIDEFDSHPYLLNTPEGTIDLKTGEMRPHNPDDLITHITKASPSSAGADLWESFLNQIFVTKDGDIDEELKAFVQQLCGMCAIGSMCIEALIIADGNGGNGKSTLFGAIQKTLGDYAITLESNSLITHTNSKNYSMAELRGVRFVKTDEFEEMQTLNTACLKKIASTDRIRAEKKYSHSFEFEPTHTPILCTNHLPAVNTNDNGTWDRLLIIPFNARIRHTDAQKQDYAKILYKEAGGSILKWIIDGAKIVIEKDSKIDEPQCVKDARQEYKDSNDWLTPFLYSTCDFSFDFEQSAGDLYKMYSRMTTQSGKRPRSSIEFKKAMESAGYERKRKNNGYYWQGLRLLSVNQR